MNAKLRLFTFSVPWNLALLTLGSMLIAIAINAVAVPHGLISGGVSGLSLLFYYSTQALSPGKWLLLLNIPIGIAGWILVSRRFLLYTVYGMIAVTVCLELISFTLPIHDIVLAAIVSGALLGAGAGTCLRSLGSSGGLDIIAVILHQRFGFRVGQVSFLCNVLVFTCGFLVMDSDTVLYSLILVYMSAQSTDRVLGMFNERKLVFIISEQAKAIAELIITEAHRGVTLLHGHGGYTGQPKDVLMTVVTNMQQKKLEELIFTIDPNAFVIFENTFNVIGKGFSQRKVY